MPKKRLDLYDYFAADDATKTNLLCPKEEYQLESPQTKTHLLKAQDEIFFFGGSSKNERLVVKINRCLKDRAEAFVYVRLSSGKIYQLEKTCDFQQSNTDSLTFSCGRLQLQCLLPMRRWRIFYSGYLRESTEDNSCEGKMTYVKFALLWRASSDVYDFMDNEDAINYLESSATNLETNTTCHSYNPQNELNFYGQAGVFHGMMTVEENPEEELYLFGQRIRYLGDISCLENEYSHYLGYAKQTGTCFHIVELFVENVVKGFTFGFVVQPDAVLKDIKDVCLFDLDNEQSNRHLFKMQFKTDLISYDLEGVVTDIIRSKNESDSNLYFKWIDFNMKDEIGYGVHFKRLKVVSEDGKISEMKSIPVPFVIPPVVSFKEEISQLSEISGGKGSSCAKLFHLSERLKTFIVPQGIVVTTSAYENFLTQEIFHAITILEEKCYEKNRKEENIKEACKRVYDEILGTEFPKSLHHAVIKMMEDYFEDSDFSQKYAVRSSSTDEDTGQMSAAGQLDTFLGVTGINEILNAVKKCWGSQFSFTAVEYKRQCGLKLNSRMAVVIQKMVPCDMAGVLFTCDPSTGNPTLMSVASNYGLGESVVSGLEEPDHILLKRDENDQLAVKSIVIGQKCHKVTVGQEGTTMKKNCETERKKCSLSDEMLFRLGYIAIEIENFFHSLMDIEWGFYNNVLYILQSRPVTTYSEDTEHEIDHEFDGPLRVENEFFTIANAGEVMPNGTSPVTIDLQQKMLRLTMATNEELLHSHRGGECNYYTKIFMYAYSHLTINFSDFFPIPENGISAKEKSFLVAFFGRIPEESEMFEVSKIRNKYSPKSHPLTALYSFIKAVISVSQIIKRTTEYLPELGLPVESCDTSVNCFKALLQVLPKGTKTGSCHLLCVKISSMLNMIVISLLEAAHGSFDEVVYREFSKLVKTGSDVESVNVPKAIQNIVFHIADDMKPEDFKKMSTEAALDWLKTSKSESGDLFRSFMEKHGHRCFQELDVYYYPWRERPEVLIKSLQFLVGSVSKEVFEQEQDNLDELLSNVSIPLGFTSRLILRWTLPFCRRAVQNRETAKSLLIKGFDLRRQALRKLAELMVSEGRLPDEDLLFFMTLDEIKILLETRSPKIVKKASHRKKRFPIVSNYKFPEIMKGFPKPINEDYEEILNIVDFSMKGTPVSQGVVKGFARVALNLKEAENIKPGEILITFCTDIAWSPYFPLLAGLVTELGGLISHGAVISREYGIPCVAGLRGATKQFRTGDFVFLDGNNGKLQKLQPPEQ